MQRLLFFVKSLGLDSVFQLAYRVIILYVIYSLSRLLFYIYNVDYFNDIDFDGFVSIFVGGLKFDTSAIIYTNILFIIGMILPFRFRDKYTYKKLLFYVFIITNSIAIVANVADIAYYPFTLRRTTCIVFSQFSNESNLPLVLLQSIVKYWYLSLFYIVTIVALVLLVRPRKKPKTIFVSNKKYYSVNVILTIIIGLLCIAGMRGGFTKSTRPITLSNAGEFVTKPNETALVLNTPFALIRTINKTGLKKVNYFPAQKVEKLYPVEYRPIPIEPFKKKNVVIIILESFSREFVGALNSGTSIKGYQGYTPFLDSLISRSLVFEHAFANGKKSIEALPSIIAGIPGTDVPYVLSPYSSNDIGSLPLLLKNKGYSTAFFHGAPNGSMGFNSFTKIAGIDSYYGKTEYANNDDFDGTWGIWDEPFFQFMITRLNTFSQPFCAGLFSVSSHEPFAIPTRYEGKLKKGPLPLHQCINYTDAALRSFFDKASKQAWYNNTVFVITADHASFPYYKEYNNSVDHFSVPLLFFTPDGSLKGRDTVTNAQQIDILPTILSYLNFDKPYISFGKNLLQNQNNIAINYLDGNYRLFRNDFVLLFDGDSKSSLYNFKHDKLLQNHIVNDTLEQSMLLQVKAFIQQYNNRLVDNRLILK